MTHSVRGIAGIINIPNSPHVKPCARLRCRLGHMCPCLCSAAVNTPRASRWHVPEWTLVSGHVVSGHSLPSMAHWPLDLRQISLHNHPHICPCFCRTSASCHSIVIIIIISFHRKFWILVNFYPSIMRIGCIDSSIVDHTDGSVLKWVIVLILLIES